MPTVHDEHRKRLEVVERVLSYLAQPENFTSPDSEFIRAIAAEKALLLVHEILEDQKPT